MRYLSVCSGIEAATVAWHPLGWEAVAFSEIEPFPCAVLAHHWPEVPNLGDMTAYKEWRLCDCNSHRQHELPDKAGQAGTLRGDRNGRRPMLHPVEDSPSCGGDIGGRCASCGNPTIDLLVGGTPCQSFSVAGLRAGLDDPRGSLMLVYLAIARRFAPRWVAWENVPGVLSSNRGRDFGTFLGGLAECGYGFAYRVLDAQWFGVPQRRRRVFVVGCLGDWRAAAAVLFERESLRGYPAPSREAGAGIAEGAVSRALSRVGWGDDPGANKGAALVAYAVNAHGGSGRMDGESETFIAFAQNTRDEVRLFGGDGKTAGACAAEPGMKQTTYIAHALRAEHDASEDGTGRGTPLVPIAFTQEQEPKWGEVGQTLGTYNGRKQGVANHSGVRLLTPRECERLQGFPDDYTLIQYPPNPRRVKWAADGPRYRALGNSMAVPVMRWIGERIAKVNDLRGKK